MSKKKSFLAQLFFNILFVGVLTLVFWRFNLSVVPSCTSLAVSALSHSIIIWLLIHLFWRHFGSELKLIKGNGIKIGPFGIPPKLLIVLFDGLQPNPQALSDKWLWSLAIVLLTLTSIFGLSPFSPLRISPIIVDTMDSTSGWCAYAIENYPEQCSTYVVDQGASITIGSTSGKIDDAVEVSFSLEEDKWVGIAKSPYPGLLTGTRAIRFSYKGSGAPNTIELKLIHVPGESKRECVCSFLWNRVTDTGDGWTSLEAPYTDFRCWAATCPPGKPLQLDVSKVHRIDFAISNKPSQGDTPGTGVVLLDDIRAIRCR